MQMDVVTFGESMVVFNPDSSGPLSHVPGFTKSLGGAESNVAIALARLGHHTGWFSKLGNDEFGRYILKSIRAEGVDTSRVMIDNAKATGILFKERFQNPNPNIYYYRKNSAASHLAPQDIDEIYIKNAKILHITGITPAISVSAREAVFKAVQIARDNQVLVSLDPNLRLKLWSLEEAKTTIAELSKYADIILPGIEEAKLLLGLEDEKMVVEYYLQMGIQTVAVKLGEAGCYLGNRNEALYVPGYPVHKVIDTVGAGDGFAAGLLSGLLKRLSLKECGEMANGVGAMATMVEGDMDGYPYFDQLMAFIGKTTRPER